MTQHNTIERNQGEQYLMSTPYRTAAPVYRSKGWHNIIPIGYGRPREKTPPVKGYTGREALAVDAVQVEAWRNEMPSSNIAIVMSNMVALDVDGPEGQQVLDLLAKKLGALPPTFSSTSRGPDSLRRHYFYRIPVTLILARLEGVLRKLYGDKLDVVHRHHRYAIVAPSVHPDGGTYAWYGPDGSPCAAPAPESVPDLPAAWCDYFAGLLAPAAVKHDDFFDAAEDFTGDHKMTHDQVGEAWRRAIARFLEKFTDGNKNNAVRDLAFESHHYGLEPSDVADVVLTHGKGRFGWTSLDAEDIGTIERARTDAEAQGQWVAEIVAEKDLPSTTLDILPPPGQPLQVARELLRNIEHSDGTPHKAWWRGDFYRWTGTHWEVEDVPELERWLYRQTGDAVYLSPPKKEGEDYIKTPWAPTKMKIGNLAHALGVGELQRTGEEDRVLAASNGVVAGRVLSPHTPKRFNLFSLPFAFEPGATAPAWQSFLDQVLPYDRQSQEFLGEWFGYVLAGRTEQQKMAALIGRKRSGKGTIARVLRALIGKENVSGLNLSTLGGTFGLEPMVGAALAVASDVRWHSRNIGDAVQILLEVSGEDAVTVHRKNKTAWSGQLGVRFMLMSNDTPTFSDRSGALVDRMLYVSFRESFFGREDTSLTEKLMEEMPGILNWALDGLDRLDGRGRFTQPDSGKVEADSTRRLADPIGAFIEDWCEVGPDQSIPLDHLYLKYRSWCESEGRDRDTTTKEIFSRDLRSKIDDLSSKRSRVDGKQQQVLHGIGSSAM